jgi:hypothetical protein
LEQVRSSPLYHLGNAHRGIDPFVIVQCTHRDKKIFELDQFQPRPAWRAFIALLPENSRY